MANEASIRVSLTIRKDNLFYQSQPSFFQADITGTAKGPVPGAMAVPTTGKIVDFGELTIPGLCKLHNLDETNYVEYGIYDPQIDVFYPLGEIMAGEVYVIRLSRNLLEEYTGTGTGTTAATNKFMLKAQGASCNCVIEAFEK